MNKRREIQIGFSIKIQLIMNQLISGISIDSVCRQVILGDVFGGAISRTVWRSKIVLDVVCFIGYTSLARDGDQFVRVNVLSVTSTQREIYLVENHCLSI